MSSNLKKVLVPIRHNRPIRVVSQRVTATLLEAQRCVEVRSHSFTNHTHAIQRVYSYSFRPTLPLLLQSSLSYLGQQFVPNSITSICCKCNNRKCRPTTNAQHLDTVTQPLMTSHSDYLSQNVTS